jgi:hypothetical protein
LGDPLSEYMRRLAARRESVTELEARDNRLANERLGVFIAGCVLAYLVYRFGGGVSWYFVVLPVAYFGVLMVRHERTLRALRDARGGVRFYEFGIARISDSWKGQGSSGEGLFPDDHPYAADLDLYGEGSLFELLCTARTRAGEQRLADWLGVGADPVTVRQRQEAVDELRNRIDLREELALFGDETRAKVHPRDLIAWADQKPLLAKSIVRPIATAVGILGVLSLAAIPLIGLAGVILVGLCSGVLFLRYRGVIQKIAGMIDQPSRELELIAQVIGRLETETFNSFLLVQLQRELRSEPFAASEAIAKLHRLVLWTESLGNQLFAPVAFLLVLPLQFAYRLEDWRALHGPNIPRWLDALGELEALVALSAYAYEHPGDPFPDLVEHDRIFDGEALGHPLLPEAECVRNDCRLDDENQLIIVSGSNMSGKSTYLRAIGINVVLAQTGAPVRAKRLRLSPFSLGATLRIQDSIHLGRSRFYAEIEKLGRLAHMGRPERPLLFLLDELLHGTNSHDRAVGGEAVLKQFVAGGGVGLVTTHDVALTSIEPQFGGKAKNVHFRDEVVEGELHFDYKLQPGPVQKGNALDLMRAVGLDV